MKATPTPAILKLLHEEGCGCDCSSMAELVMSEACGITGEDIMFSSNQTPPEDFQKAAQLGAVINLDDLTLVDELETALEQLPETVCCRYNPGGVFTLGETREGFQVMDNPGDAKDGMTRPQIAEAFTRLQALGVKEFGIHAFLASNTLSNDYYPARPGSCFSWRWSFIRKPVFTSASSIFPAASAFPICRISLKTIFLSLGRVSGRPMKSSSSLPVWAMWRFIRSWGGLCWLLTVIW